MQIRCLMVLLGVWWSQSTSGHGTPQSHETLDSMVDARMEAMDRSAAAAWRKGELTEAVKLYKEMTAYRPRHADSHFNVGIALYALGEHSACMQAMDQALRLPSGVPHHSMYHQQMAACACKLGERLNDHILWDKCIRHLTQAIGADPQNVVAWATAATNYMALGYEQMAIRASDTAARLSPKADALSALGINYARVGRYRDAIRCFRRALEDDPRLHRTRVELLHAMSAVADWRGYTESIRHVRSITQQQLANNEYTFLQPFDALAHPIPNDMLRGIARSYALDSLRNADNSGQPIFQHTPPALPAAAAAGFPTPSPRPAVPPSYPPHRRLHIGYVSADWTERAAVGRAIRAGILHHRRDRVLVTAYTLRNQRAVDSSEYHAALSSAVERVVAFEQFTDAAAAARINEDGVDVLANLGGYTSSARTEIFALHPAALQVLLQGFAGTSGAPFLEYNLLDAVQAPPEHAAFYSERLQLLPVSAFRGEGTGREVVLEGSAKAAQRRRLGLPAPPAFVAANLNRPYKLEPRIFASWLSMLARTAGLHLWMVRWPDALAAEACLKREIAEQLAAWHPGGRGPAPRVVAAAGQAEGRGATQGRGGVEGRGGADGVGERVVFTDLLPLEDKIRFAPPDPRSPSLRVPLLPTPLLLPLPFSRLLPRHPTPNPAPCTLSSKHSRDKGIPLHCRLRSCDGAGARE
jgi:protein O-GlcNAc transferase